MRKEHSSENWSCRNTAVKFLENDVGSFKVNTSRVKAMEKGSCFSHEVFCFHILRSRSCSIFLTIFPAGWGSGSVFLDKVPDPASVELTASVGCSASDQCVSIALRFTTRSSESSKLPPVSINPLRTGDSATGPCASCPFVCNCNVTIETVCDP